MDREYRLRAWGVSGAAIGVSSELVRKLEAAHKGLEQNSVIGDEFAIRSALDALTLAAMVQTRLAELITAIGAQALVEEK